MTRAGAGRSATGRWGFGSALREVFPDDPRAALLVPQDRECSCRAAEVGARAGAKKALARDLERRGQTTTRRRRSRRSRSTYGAKFPKAVAKITDDARARCSAFFDYPAEHWIHLRTTNPIESRPSPRFVHRQQGDQGTGLTRGRASPWRSS